MRSAQILVYLLLTLTMCGLSKADESADAKVAEQLLKSWWEIIDRDALQSFESCKRLRLTEPIYKGAEAVATPELMARIGSTFGNCSHFRYERIITTVTSQGASLIVETRIRTIQPESASGPESHRSWLAPIHFRYLFVRSQGQWRLGQVLRQPVSLLDGSPYNEWSPIYAPPIATFHPQPYLQ